MESLESMLTNVVFCSDWSTKDTNALKTAESHRVYIVSKAGDGVSRILLIRNSNGQYEPPIAKVDQINAKLILQIDNAAKQVLALDIADLKVSPQTRVPATIIEDRNGIDKLWNQHANEAKAAQSIPDYVMARIDNFNTLLNQQQNEFARINDNQAEIKVMNWYIPMSVSGLLSMNTYNRLIAH